MYICVCVCIHICVCFAFAVTRVSLPLALSTLGLTGKSPGIGGLTWKSQVLGTVHGDLIWKTQSLGSLRLCREASRDFPAP